MSAAGHWDYDDPAQHIAYGPQLTYIMAADWLEPCKVVEDWGCGLSQFATFRKGVTVGVDGSPGPSTLVVADLTEYVTETDGVLLRHVLEHNRDWRLILDNACRSFIDRMCVVLFTPFASTDTELAWVDGYEVPDLALHENDFYETLEMHGADHRTLIVPSSAGYGTESVVCCLK